MANYLIIGQTYYDMKTSKTHTLNEVHGDKHILGGLPPVTGKEFSKRFCLFSQYPNHTKTRK